MTKFTFKVDDPELYQFYADLELVFDGLDMTVEEMYERFEQFMLGLGYQPNSLQKFYAGKTPECNCESCACHTKEATS